VQCFLIVEYLHVAYGLRGGHTQAVYVRDGASLPGVLFLSLERWSFLSFDGWSLIVCGRGDMADWIIRVRGE